MPTQAWVKVANGHCTTPTFFFVFLASIAHDLKEFLFLFCVCARALLLQLYQECKLLGQVQLFYI